MRRADDWVFHFDVATGKNLGGKHSPPVYSRPALSERGKRFGSYSITTVAFEEEGLSRVSFWGSYVKLENAIEVRFDAEGNARVDGDPVPDDALARELGIRELLFGTDQLCVVGDEFSTVAPLLEKVAVLRTLGFREITITTDYMWHYDAHTNHWSRRE